MVPLMPRPNPAVFLPLWDRALDPDVEIGIAFKVSGIDRQQFRDTILYAARKAAPDPSIYSSLITFLPGGDHTDEVWICKREVDLGENA